MIKTRRKFIILLALCALICMPTMAMAGTIFTDETAFLADIVPGYYLNDFNELGGYSYLGTNPRNYSGGSGPYSYTITSSGGFYSTGHGALSTLNNTDVMTITFTGAPVTAVGGQFFLTDYNGNDLNGQVKVTFSDGNIQTVTMSGSRPFLGYSVLAPESPISSLTIVSIRPDNQDSYYPTMDHIYVGNQVPLPGAMLLLGAGMVRLVAYARRREE